MAGAGRAGVGVGRARTQVIAALVVALLAPLLSVAPVGPVAAQEPAEVRAPVERIGGVGRVETAVAVSEAFFDSAAEVVLARAGDFPDALAAGPLARSVGGPILLTPTGSLPDAVVAELMRLDVERVTVVGGAAAVSPTVEGRLRGLGLEMRRLGGVDRYETARLIAGEVGSADGRVVLARGRGDAGADGFADALTAGTFGITGSDIPTVLTEQAVLPAATAEVLRGRDDLGVTVVGGPAAVSNAVEGDVSGLVGSVERLAGRDRFATSVVVADAVSAGVREPVTLLVATGESFPDGLVAGSLTEALESPIVLVPGGFALSTTGSPGDRLAGAAPEVAQYLRDVCPTVQRAVVLGATAAVSADVHDAVAELLTCAKEEPVSPGPPPPGTPSPTSTSTSTTTTTTTTTTAPAQPGVVPDIVGFRQLSAITAVDDADLVPRLTATEPHPTVPAGRVLRQDPTPGTAVALGSEVAYVLSSGPSLVTVPLVVGLSAADARDEIEGAGLDVGREGTTESDTVDPDEVDNQLPLAGLQVLPGTPVDIEVATGGVNDPPEITSTPPTTKVIDGNDYVYAGAAIDLDGDDLTWVLQAGPSNAGIDAATGVVTWKPRYDDIGPVVLDDTGPHDFAVRVEDGRGGIDTQSFTLTVTRPNQAPTANDDQLQATTGEARVIDATELLGNDTDPEGDTLTITDFTQPQTGVLTRTGPTQLTYTPNRPGGSDVRTDIELTHALPVTVTSDAATNSNYPLTRLLDDYTSRDWFTTSSQRAPITLTFAFEEDVDVRRLGVFGARQFGEDGYDVESFDVRVLAADGTVLFDQPGYEMPDDASPGDGADADGSFDLTADNDGEPITGARSVEITITEVNDAKDYPGIAEIDIWGDAAPRLFRPRLKWHDAEFTALSAPSAGDLDGDGISEVVVTQSGNRLSSYDGATGALEWRRTDAYTQSQTAAIGDVVGCDWSGAPAECEPGDLEVVYIGSDSSFIRVADARGNLVAELDTPSTMPETSLVLADVDADGSVEAIGGRNAGVQVVTIDPVDGSMSVLSTTSHGSCGNNSYRQVCLPVVVDVDVDGQLEIVTGDRVFDAATGRLEQEGRGIGGDAFVGVANFDDDPEGEIVRVDNGTLHIVNHDFTTVFGPVPLAARDGETSTGSGGPPTIGDFDADGRPEIGIAGGRVYAVYDPDLPLSETPLQNEGVLWKAPTVDGSSSRTGSTLFDFDDDGAPEVVYASEQNLWIYDGPTGAVRWSRPISSGTTVEYPVVADVDGDHQAELLVHVEGERTVDSTVHPRGITVYDATADDWVRARSIWNQHAYSVTNVGSDGSIPAVPDVHWLEGGLNSFRQQAFPADDDSRLDQFTYDIADPSGAPGQATVFLDVRPPQNDPVITCGPGPVATLGYEVRSRVCASDPDGDALTFDGTAFLATTTRVTPNRNPWLAGAPDGTTGSGSAAPADSPVLVADAAFFSPGEALTFKAEGNVGTTSTLYGPEGFDGETTEAAQNGLASLRAKWAATIGVFLDDTVPVPGDQPAGLDFSDAGLGEDFTSLAPELRQPFFIGDGRTSDGVVQEFIVPEGATRLFLGVMDDDNWASNVGDGHQVTVLSPRPAGIAIDPATGVLTWTPAAVGSVRLDVTVTDDSFQTRSTERSWVIDVRPPTTVPDLAGPPRLTEADARAAVLAAGLIVGTVDEVSSVDVPVGEVVTQFPPAGSTAQRGGRVLFSVSSGPSPADVDADGDGFTPNQGDCDDRDPEGAGIHPGATEIADDGIDQDCDGEDEVTPPAGEPDPADIVAVGVTGSDAPLVVGRSRPYTAQALRRDGRVISIADLATFDTTDASVATVDGRTVTAVAPGSFGVTASYAGLTAQKNLTAIVEVVADEVPPVADITSPLPGDEVGAELTVTGSASDDNLTGWTLTVIDDVENVLVEAGRGTSAVVDGALGTISSAAMPPGQVTVRLDVEDSGGNVSRIDVPVRVPEGPQVGAFELLFTDLVVPVVGVPLQVTRRYDSRDGRPGDFGAGWNLDLGGLDLSLTPDQGSGWELVSGRFGSTQLVSTSEQAVTISLPDGREEVFDLTPSPAAANFQALSFTQATYVPRFGTVGRLQPRGNTNLLVLAGGPDGVELVDDTTLQTYRPEGFVYTAPDGSVFTIDVDGTIETVRDPNGNTVTVSVGGIQHSAGPSVDFERDAKGRITSITDMEGNVQRYGYSASGDLTSHTDVLGNTTRYRYVAQHKLFEIIDPLGRVVERREYDPITGRLTAVVGPDGARIELMHDIDGRQEIIRDADGFTMVFTYDDDGNVLASTDQLGHTSTFTYDGLGNQLTETDPTGLTTTRTFDTSGNPLTVTAPGGATTTYTYDDAGRVISVVDPVGNTTNRTYDSRGNLLRVEDASGVLEQNSYDARGNLVSRTGPDGSTIRREVDALGREIELELATGGIVRSDYDASGGLIGITNALGGTTTLGLNEADAPVSVTDADGGTVDLLRGPTGELVGVVDQGGNAIEHEFDAAGREIRRVDAVGNVTLTTYTSAGDVATVTDPAGGVTTYRYDAADRLVEVEDPTGAITRYEYDAAGRRTAEVDPEGNRTEREHHPVTGDLVAVVDPVGGRATLEYDDRGQLTASTDPTGRTTRFTYDARGNQTGSTLPDGTVETRMFDAAGRETSITDALGRVTTFAHDSGGNVTRVVDALGGITTATYDDAGNQTSITDAEGRTTRYRYDHRSRLVETIFPSGASEQIHYDPDGDVDRIVDRNGESIDMVHDAAGRLVAEALPDGTVRETAWTPNGEVASVSYQGRTVDYGHDGAGRVRSVTHGTGESLTYERDGRGLVTSVTAAPRVGDPFSIDYEHDPVGRLIGTIDRSGRRSTTTYDGAGRELTRTTPDGTVETRSYDAAGRVDLLTHASSGATLLQLDYERDLVGNITGIASPEAGTATYSYDALDRLVTERHVDGSGTVLADRSYTYDAVGNRVGETIDGATVTSTFDADDRILTRGDTTFTHDAEGRLLAQTTAGATEQYGWDGRGLLTSVVGADGQVQRTIFDPTGELYSRSVGGDVTGYVVDPLAPGPVSQVLAETDAAGSVLAELVWDGDQVSERRDGATSYFHHDLVHTTRTATDQSGALVASAAHTAFGDLLSEAGDMPTSHRFAGQHTQVTSGLIDMRARTYDPTLGRFLSVDPETGTVADPINRHPYEYARNNPLTYWDPTGELSTLAEGAIVSGLLSATISITVDLVVSKGAKKTSEILFNAAINGVLGAIGGAAGSAIGAKVLSEIGKLGGQIAGTLVETGFARAIVGTSKGAVATIFAELSVRWTSNGKASLGVNGFVLLFALNSALETFFLGDAFRTALQRNFQLAPRALFDVGESFGDLLIDATVNASSRELLDSVISETFKELGQDSITTAAFGLFRTLSENDVVNAFASILLNTLAGLGAS